MQSSLALKTKPRRSRNTKGVLHTRKQKDPEAPKAGESEQCSNLKECGLNSECDESKVIYNRSEPDPPSEEGKNKLKIGIQYGPSRHEVVRVYIKHSKGNEEGMEI